MVDQYRSTCRDLIWFNEETKIGLKTGYPDIILHAILQPSKSDQSDVSLFLQVEAGEIALPDGTKLFEEDHQEGDEDDCLTWDVTLKLESAEIAEQLFKTISDHSASLNMDDVLSHDELGSSDVPETAE